MNNQRGTGIPSVNVICRHFKEYTEQSCLMLLLALSMFREGLHELVQLMDHPAQPFPLMDLPVPFWFMMSPICSRLGWDKDVYVMQGIVVGRGFGGWV